MSNQSLASFILIAAPALWGVYWVPLLWLESHDISGIMAVALLNLAPAVVLLALAFRSRTSGPAMMQALWVGAIAGLGFGLYSAGIVYGSVVRATLLFYLTPVWSTLIGMAVLKERAGPRRWIAIATGLGGVGLLVSSGPQAALNIGDGFALVSGLMWAIAAVGIRKSPSLPLTGLTGAQFASTTGLAVLIAATFGADFPAPAQITDVLTPTLLVGLGIMVPSVAAIFWAQKRVSPGRAGLFMMSEVLVAVLTASLFLPEERLNGLQGIGAILIVSTFFIENGRLRLPQRRHPA